MRLHKSQQYVCSLVLALPFNKATNPNKPDLLHSHLNTPESNPPQPPTQQPQHPTSTTPTTAPSPAAPIARIPTPVPATAAQQQQPTSRAASAHPDPAPPTTGFTMPTEAAPHGAPVRQYINSKITGVLLEGMKIVAREQYVSHTQIFDCPTGWLTDVFFFFLTTDPRTRYACWGSFCCSDRGRRRGRSLVHDELVVFILGGWGREERHNG